MKPPVLFLPSEAAEDEPLLESSSFLDAFLNDSDDDFLESSVIPQLDGADREIPTHTKPTGKMVPLWPTGMGRSRSEFG